MRKSIVASYITMDGVWQAPGGEVKFGSFVPVEASEAELARRKKWSRE